MKYSDMVDGKTYSCSYLGCKFISLTKQQIANNHPWMMEIPIWKED